VYVGAGVGSTRFFSKGELVREEKAMTHISLANTELAESSCLLTGVDDVDVQPTQALAASDLSSLESPLLFYLSFLQPHPAQHL